MRIAIDLQAAQASNERRGIGRYAMALTEALLTEFAGDHKFVVVMNGQFPASFDQIADHLRTLTPRVTIEVWYPPRDMGGARDADQWTRRATEAIREEFIASLEPDVIVVMSLFEGFVDAAVTSVRSLGTIPTAVVLYDLIPLARRADYLSDPAMEAWYEGKIGHLRRADLLLAISGATRDEALDLLDLAPDTVVDVGAAVRPTFEPGEVDGAISRRLRDALGLSRRFLMYTGGIDPRKNVEGLIDAYALLPNELRQTAQLAVVCSVEDTARVAIQRRCQQLGLAADEVIVTGYVSDDDLLALYRMCEASVFPSLHEGFGLPALEAMSCGRAVIASNRSSLPEVVGNPDALFDPTSTESMAAKMAEVLGDDEFRAELARKGLEHSKKFSWSSTARRAMAAIETMVAAAGPAGGAPAGPGTGRARPTMAYLSPLPPEQSGISDYSAMLVPHLASYYDVDLISDLETTTDPWLAANCTVRSVEWFRQHHAHYDRVVYQMGNSSFHAHMFDLLERIPGIVVLHDFALSGIVAHADALGESSRGWVSELYHSHGYAALIDQRDAATRSDVVWAFPVNLRVLQQSLGVVVHSQTARQLADHWYGPGSSSSWSTIPMPRSTAGAPSRAEARHRLGIDDDVLLVASFGNIGPTKLSDRLVQAWSRSSLAGDDRCRLVLVGDSHDPAFDGALRGIINELGPDGRVRITGRVDAETYAMHLAAADVGVQLRARSRGETSASAFDCLSYGLATIVNANGALAELPDDSVVRISDDFGDDELVRALEQLRSDPELRTRLGRRARSFIAQHHTPRVAAGALAEAIELHWERPINRRERTVGAISRLPCTPQRRTDLADVALSITSSLPVTPRPRQLLIDVSELSVRDAGSGIQRVTRNVVAAMLNRPPSGYRVEPVAAGIHSEFRAARRFTSELLGLDLDLTDDLIEFGPGDVFLGLDLQPLVVPSHRELFRRLRRGGVTVAFVVYDLLPMLVPEHFYPGAAEMYERWLTTAREADRLIAISRSVQHDVERWLDDHPSTGHRPALSWFHLGVELEHARPNGSTGPGDEPVRDTTAFLMVGTLEPRKRHAQVLDAFELLWARGRDIDLVIAGRVGWMMDEFVKRLRRHPELGKHLHWVENASDDRLAALYVSSAALVAASDAEGFGLPLIEAAKFGLPIIARDLAVFREVAGEHATYFSGHRPDVLAGTIEQWIEHRDRGSLPSSTSIPLLSWSDSAEQLLAALLADDHE